MARREAGIEYLLIVRKETTGVPRLGGSFPTMKEASAALKEHEAKNPDHYVKIESRTLYEYYDPQPIEDWVPIDEEPATVSAK